METKTNKISLLFFLFKKAFEKKIGSKCFNVLICVIAYYFELNLLFKQI